jgi:hypothetical protein
MSKAKNTKLQLGENITEEDMSLIKALFEKLNPEKRQQMVSTLFESAENFYGNIKFAKKAKGLL